MCVISETCGFLPSTILVSLLLLCLTDAGYAVPGPSRYMSQATHCWDLIQRSTGIIKDTGSASWPHTARSDQLLHRTLRPHEGGGDTITSYLYLLQVGK